MDNHDDEINSILSWSLKYLKGRNIILSTLLDFNNGIYFINLIEILYNINIKYNIIIKNEYHKLNNVTIALSYIEKLCNIKIVSVDSAMIVNNNDKAILNLLWLILHSFIAKKLRKFVSTHEGENTTLKNRLISWSNVVLSKMRIAEGINLSEKEFVRGLKDGRALCHLIKCQAHSDCIDVYTVDYVNTPEQNLQLALKTSKEVLGIQAYLSLPILFNKNELTMKERDKIEQELINFMCFIACADRKRSSTISVTNSMIELTNNVLTSDGNYEYHPCRIHTGKSFSKCCLCVAGSTADWVFLQREWDKFLPELKQMPSISGFPIKCLDISGTGLGDSMCIDLVNFLLNFSIEYLTLSFNAITDIGCTSLGILMDNQKEKEGRGLKILNLSCNSITDEGARILLKALPQSYIIKLELEDNSEISDETMDAIAHICYRNHMIKTGIIYAPGFECADETMAQQKFDVAKKRSTLYSNYGTKLLNNIQLDASLVEIRMQAYKQNKKTLETLRRRFKNKAELAKALAEEEAKIKEFEEKKLLNKVINFDGQKVALAIAEHKKQVALEQKIERELIDEEYKNNSDLAKASRLKGIPMIHNSKQSSDKERREKIALKLKEIRPVEHFGYTIDPAKITKELKVQKSMVRIATENLIALNKKFKPSVEVNSDDVWAKIDIDFIDTYSDFEAVTVICTFDPPIEDFVFEDSKIAATYLQRHDLDVLEEFEKASVSKLKAEDEAVKKQLQLTRKAAAAGREKVANLEKELLVLRQKSDFSKTVKGTIKIKEKFFGSQKPEIGDFVETKTGYFGSNKSYLYFLGTTCRDLDTEIFRGGLTEARSSSQGNAFVVKRAYSKATEGLKLYLEDTFGEVHKYYCNSSEAVETIIQHIERSRRFELEQGSTGESEKNVIAETEHKEKESHINFSIKISIRDVEAQESKMALLTKQSYDITIKLRDLETAIKSKNSKSDNKNIQKRKLQMARTEFYAEICGKNKISVLNRQVKDPQFAITIHDTKNKFEIKDDWSPGARIRSASNNEKITESIFQNQKIIAKAFNFKLNQNKNAADASSTFLEIETMELSKFEKVSAVTRKSIYSSANANEVKETSSYKGNRISVNDSDDFTPPPPPQIQRIRANTGTQPPPPPQRDNRAFTTQDAVPPPPPRDVNNYDHLISRGRAETVESVPPPPPPKINTALKVSQPLQASGSKFSSTLSMTDAPKPVYIPVAGVIIGPKVGTFSKPPASLLDPSATSTTNGPSVGPQIGNFKPPDPSILSNGLPVPPIASNGPPLNRSTSSTPLAPKLIHTTSNADGNKNFSTPLSPRTDSGSFSTPLKPPGMTRSSSANNLQDAVKNPAIPKNSSNTSSKPQGVLPKAVLPQFSRAVSHLVASDNELSQNADVLKAFGDTAGAPPPLLSKKFTAKQYKPMDY